MYETESYNSTPVQINTLCWAYPQVNRLSNYVYFYSLGVPLVAGSTPLGMYRKLVEFHKEGKLSFKYVKTFNMDEYVGMYHPLLCTFNPWLASLPSRYPWWPSRKLPHLHVEELLPTHWHQPSQCSHIGRQCRGPPAGMWFIWDQDQGVWRSWPIYRRQEWDTLHVSYSVQLVYNHLGPQIPGP